MSDRAQEPARAPAATFPSASAALDAMDMRSSVVEAGLEAVRRGSSPLRKSATKILSELRRCRDDRRAIRRVLGLLPGALSPVPTGTSSLRDLRAAVQDLVFAHAEGIPALENPKAVTLLVPDLLDVARHLALIDLWVEGQGKDD